MNTNEIHQLLQQYFSGKIGELTENPPFEPFISFTPEAAEEIMSFLHNNEFTRFNSLVNLSAVDEADGLKTTDENGSLIINGGKLSVYYHLESTELRHKLLLKTSTSRETPEIASVTPVWAHANWHEREAYDMFGIIFTNHPNLIRILMPYDWEAGFPLRKDYKDPEFYKGMKVPY